MSLPASASHKPVCLQAVMDGEPRPKRAKQKVVHVEDEDEEETQETATKRNKPNAPGEIKNLPEEDPERAKLLVSWAHV